MSINAFDEDKAKLVTDTADMLLIHMFLKKTQVLTIASRWKVLLDLPAQSTSAVTGKIAHNGDTTDDQITWLKVWIGKKYSKRIQSCILSIHDTFKLLLPSYKQDVDHIHGTCDRENSLLLLVTDVTRAKPNFGQAIPAKISVPLFSRNMLSLPRLVGRSIVRKPIAAGML